MHCHKNESDQYLSHCFSSVNLLIKRDIFIIIIIIIMSVFLHSQKRCRCVIYSTMCDSSRSVVYAAHIKLKPWESGKKALFVSFGKSSKLIKCCHYTFLRNSLCCTQAQAISNTCVHELRPDVRFDRSHRIHYTFCVKFILQVLCRNDRMHNFRWYVRFVNEAHFVIRSAEKQTQPSRQRLVRTEL